MSPFLDPQSLSEAIANYVHERRLDIAQTAAISLVTRADLFREVCQASLQCC